ncbi:MAG: permease-like cell division protein FtsX [Candidatus Paceibacterota bacterium]
MMWITTKRIIRAGFIGFWRSGYVSVSSVLVLTVTLFVIGMLMLSSAFLESTLTNLEDRVDISVTFKADAPEVEIRALQVALEELPEVRSVIYTSRAEELRNFEQRHQDNSLLIQSLNEVGNPFGARLSVLATNPSQYEVIARFLDSHSDSQIFSEPIIDQVSFKRDIIDKLLGVIDTSRTISLTVSSLLIALSILVTFTTISLAIYVSREEISVMRLVGAANSYIRGPFMVQGVIAGLISAFIATSLLYPSVVWVRNATAGVYGGVNLVPYFLDNFAQIFLTLLLSGIVLGVISSFLAARKYLKV